MARSWPPSAVETHAQTQAQTPTHVIPVSYCRGGKCKVHLPTSLLWSMALDTNTWLTGLCVNMPFSTSDESSHVQIVLKKRGDKPMFDCRDDSEWIQPVNVWRKFPWAIPAVLVTELDIILEITFVSLESDNVPVFYGVTIGAHVTKPEVTKPEVESFLFADADGTIVYIWDGLQEEDGSPTGGRALTINTVTSFRVVPPLADACGWVDNTVFTPHSWDSVAPMKWK